MKFILYKISIKSFILCLLSHHLHQPSYIRTSEMGNCFSSPTTVVSKEDPNLAIIKEIHKANALPNGCKITFAVTGGGASGIAAMLGVPGASKTVLNALVPYAQAAFLKFIEPAEPPKSYASIEAADKLAVAALDNSKSLLSDSSTPVGIGLAAALASGDRRGADHMYVSVRTSTCNYTYEITLNKGARTRDEEEKICGFLLILATAKISCPSYNVNPPTLLPGETFKHNVKISTPLFSRAHADLVSGKFNSLLVNTKEVLVNKNFDGKALIFPGSFNPFHDGHKEMARLASAMTGHPCILEISILNVDKPSLESEEILTRMAPLISMGFSVLLTRAPRFYDKTKLLSRTTFLVGTDTVERILDPKYCGGNSEVMVQELKEMKDNGIHFIVANRINKTGEFINIEEMTRYKALSEEFRSIFKSIPGFRLDMSSTAIRASTM